jgi:hypothetical protein
VKACVIPASPKLLSASHKHALPASPMYVLPPVRTILEATPQHVVFYELRSNEIGSYIDAHCGDGQMLIACLKNNIPYTGRKKQKADSLRLTYFKNS